MPQLNRLTVRGFKSIRALEDFELRGLNVLIGANGAGKSNLLSLFQMLNNLVEKRLQLFVKGEGGPHALLFGGLRRTPSIEAELIFDGIRYRFSLQPAADELVFATEDALFPGVTEKGHWLVEDRKEPFFAVGSNGLSVWFRGGHEEARLPDVEQSEFTSYVRPAIASWRVYHFHDTSGAARVRQAQAVRDNLSLHPDAGNLGSFLRRLRERHPEHYRRIVDVVRLAAPFFGDFVYRKDVDEQVGLEWFEANDPDTVFGSHQISDGTLRFICLATLLLQPPHLQPELILIDEPELGLHPFALTLLAEMLQHAGDERQIIVSTQSADLVNEVAPEDVVVVNRWGGESVFERLEPDRLRDWLEDYSLGDLWKMNIFGGRPA